MPRHSLAKEVPGRLGAPWGCPGPSWGRPGPSWGCFGPSWGRLGAVSGLQSPTPEPPRHLNNQPTKQPNKQPTEQPHILTWPNQTNNRPNNRTLAKQPHIPAVPSHVPPLPLSPLLPPPHYLAPSHPSHPSFPPPLPLLPLLPPSNLLCGFSGEGVPGHKKTKRPNNQTTKQPYK